MDTAGGAGVSATGLAVQLTWAELQQAAFVGCQRQLRAMSRGRVHRYGKPDYDEWGINIAAAAAEMAVAKTLDVYWADASRLDYDGDVGAFQVRSTELPHGCLILHEGDADDQVYVLVVGAPPAFTIAGWLLGRDGKRPEFWQTDRTRTPCFLVPQAALHAPGDLRYAVAAAEENR